MDEEISPNSGVILHRVEAFEPLIADRTFDCANKSPGPHEHPVGLEPQLACNGLPAIVEPVLAHGATPIPCGIKKAAQKNFVIAGKWMDGEDSAITSVQHAIQGRDAIWATVNVVS